MYDAIEPMKEEVVTDSNTTSTMKSFVSRITQTRKDLRKYPHIFFMTNGDIIRALGTRFAGQLKGAIYEIEGLKDHRFPVSYELKRPNYIAFVESFPHLNQLFMVVFSKDKNSFKNEIEKLEITYPIGSYFLTQGMTGYRLTNINTLDEDAPLLEKGMSDQINIDINSFFKKEKFFRDNKLTFKRGIMFYGPPGNGKTSYIKHLIKRHKDKYVVIIDCTKDFNKNVSDYLKIVLGNKEKIIIFEDIDGIDMYSRSAMLNFLDGLDSMETTLVIATTNNIGRVDPALINRPSRFDRVYKFGLPNKENRSELLKRFFPKLTKAELSRYVTKTEGFAGAYFKELFIFKNLQSCSIDKAIDNLKKQLGLYQKFSRSKDINYMG